MSRSAESNLQLASGGRDDLRQLFALSFSEPARDDEDLRHAVLDYVRIAKLERRTPEMVIVSLKRAIIDAAAARISYRAANELTDRVVTMVHRRLLRRGRRPGPFSTRIANGSGAAPELEGSAHKVRVGGSQQGLGGITWFRKTSLRRILAVTIRLAP